MRTEEEIRKTIKVIEDWIPRCTKQKQNRLKIRIEQLNWVLGEYDFKI